MAAKELVDLYMKAQGSTAGDQQAAASYRSAQLHGVCSSGHRFRPDGASGALSLRACRLYVEPARFNQLRRPLNGRSRSSELLSPIRRSRTICATSARVYKRQGRTQARVVQDGAAEPGRGTQVRAGEIDVISLLDLAPRKSDAGALLDQGLAGADAWRS